MPDFIYKPAANAAGIFSDTLEYVGVNVTNVVDPPAGTFDIYMKVQSGLVISAPSNAFVFGLVDETPVVDNISGTISIQIESGPNAGTYTTRVTDGATITSAMAAAGLVPFTPLTLSGNPDVGDTITVRPSLWFGDPENTAESTFVYKSDGVIIPGQNALSILVSLEMLGKDLTCEETRDGTTVVSNTISIPAAANIPFALTQLTALTQSPNGSSQQRTVDLSAYAPGTRIIIMGTTPSGAATAASVGGQAATAIGAPTSNSFAFQYALPLQGQASTVIQVLMPSSSRNTMKVFALEGGQVTGSATLTGAGATTATVNAPIPTSAANAILAVSRANGEETSFTWGAPLSATDTLLQPSVNATAARANNVPMGAATPVSLSPSSFKGVHLTAITVSEAS